MLELKVSLAMCSSLELGGGNGLQSIGAAELESAILINITGSSLIAFRFAKVAGRNFVA